MWTVNFQMFKLVLEKAEEPEIELPTSTGSWKKQESSRKTATSALLTMPKPLTVWITTNCEKFWKRWEYQTTWPASWEGQEATVRTGHGTTDWFQIGKGVRQASLVAQRLKHLPATRETSIRSLGWEDPLEKEMATHCSILAWRIPWTKEPGGLQSMGPQKVGHDWATSLSLSRLYIVTLLT